MTITDLVIITALTLIIPKMVERHLFGYVSSRELRIAIVFGGMAWVVFSCSHELIYSLLGTVDADSVRHRVWAYTRIVENIQNQNYAIVFRYLTSPGRNFYIAYQGLFYYFTGGTEISILAINAFMAFWGSLTLCRVVYSFAPMTTSGGPVLPLILIFAPSVVFWTGANLKEAFIYWSICQVFAFVRPATSNRQMFRGFGFFVVALALGLLIRPHMIFIWFIGVVLVKLFQPLFLKYAVVLVLLSPFIVGQVEKKVGVITNPIKVIQRGKESMRLLLLRPSHHAALGKSTFYLGENGPIPVLSGLKNVLFRPYFWKFSNLRSVVTAMEIWSISVVMLFLWLRAPVSQLKLLFKNPLVQVAFLVSIPFFFFFTYFPNEGLIARQRVQVFPALLVLLTLPVLLRKSYPKDQLSKS